MAAPVPGTTAQPFDYGGHTLWLQPDGSWTNGQSASSSKVDSATVAQLMAGAGTPTVLPTTPTSTTPAVPTTGATSIPGIGNYPPATGVNVTQPAGDPYGMAARFGGVPGGALGPLNYRLYTGTMSTAGLPAGSTNAPGGGPVAGGSPAPVPSPSPAPVPSAPGGSSGSPTTAGGGTGGLPGAPSGVGGGPSGGNGSGPGGVGNAGGAQGNGLSFGNGGAGVSATPSPGSTDIAAALGLTPGSLGYLDIGDIGTGLLGAASMVTPFPYSLIPTVLGAAGRGYNTSVTDAIRAAQGIPGLDIGQVIGSVLGLNNYGALNGNATVANPSQYGDLQKSIDAKQTGSDPFASLFKTNTLGLPTAETAGGAPYSDGLGGLLGLIFGGGTTPAASVQTTNDQLSGDEAAKELASISGLTLDQARAVLKAMQQGLPGSTALTPAAPPLPGALDAGVLNTNKPGSTTLVNPTTGQISYQGGTGSTAQNNPPGSFSGTTAGGTLAPTGEIGTPYGVTTPPSGLNQGMVDTAATQLAANQAAKNASGGSTPAPVTAGPVYSAPIGPVQGPVSVPQNVQTVSAAPTMKYDPNANNGNGAWVKINSSGTVSGSNNAQNSGGAIAGINSGNPTTGINASGGNNDTGFGVGSGAYAKGGYVGNLEANRPWKDRAQSRPAGSGSLLWDPTTGWTIDLMVPHDPAPERDPQQERSGIRLAPRKASFATGGPVGFRGMLSGGPVPGRPDQTMDNRPILANEGEFVVRNSAADALGPTVLNWLNNAPNAAKARALLANFIPGERDRQGATPAAAAELRQLLNREPLMMRSSGIERPGRQEIGVSGPPDPRAQADLFAAMDAEAGRGPASALPGPMQQAPQMGPFVQRLPMPMQKPGQPTQMAIEGGWPTLPIPGHGIGVGWTPAKGRATAQAARAPAPTESDRLNQQMVAMIIARRAAQQAAAGQGLRFGV